jgi:hypothetical protein
VLASLGSLETRQGEAIVEWMLEADEAQNWKNVVSYGRLVIVIDLVIYY